MITDAMTEAPTTPSKVISMAVNHPQRGCSSTVCRWSLEESFDINNSYQGYEKYQKDKASAHDPFFHFFAHLFAEQARQEHHK
jgi:hypothetical protein